jgi:hypothetical protein
MKKTRLNNTVVTTSTKSTTNIFSQEIDEDRLENAKQRQKQFQNCEKKLLVEQVEDLTATLQINKQLMSEVFAS